MREQKGAIGKLIENMVQSGIKSINRYTYYSAASSGNGTIAIKEVVPANCIVLVERTKNVGTSDIQYYSYTFEATQLKVSHPAFSGAGYIALAFTVVEFYSIGGQ